MQPIYITREGYEKLLKDLEDLRKLKADLSVEIGEAMSQGDLRENAAYTYAKEKQAETHNSFPQTFPVKPAEKGQKITKSEYRNSKQRNLKVKTEQCNNPCSNSRSNIGSKNNPDRLCKGKQARIDKRNDHNCCCAG